MKRNKKTLLVLSSLSLAAFGLAGCDSEPTLSVPSEVVEKNLNVTTSNTTIALANVSSFDAKTLFKITDDGKEVAISADMLSGSVEAKVGSYTITLTYKGKTYTSNVNVVDLTPEVVTKKVNLESTNLTIELKDFRADDVKKLFKITDDGKEIEVKDEMLNVGDLTAAVGEYEVTLTYEGIKVTSKINIIENTERLSLVAHNQTLELGEAENFEAENLFTITDDGKNVVVRASMIDESKFNRSEVGEYEVTLNYKGKAVTATVNVVANKKVTASVNSDMLICHKGDESYDVKEAFSVYAGDKKLTITDEMLSGSVDYNRTGIYDIKLTYDYYGELTIVNAKINVLPEVVIATPNGDSFVGKGVYAGDAMFKHAENFVATADGISLPFDAKLVDTNLVFNKNNLAQTGKYYATYKIVVDGVEFSKTINYEIYAHKAEASDSKVTYKASELTSDNINPFKIFYLKINGSSATYSGLDVEFVPASMKDTHTPTEGKTPIYYTIDTNIVFGTPGVYDYKISFELDGLTYEFATKVTVENDVTITEASSKPVNTYKGASSFDYKSMFKVTKYDGESQSTNKVEVTDEMIDSSKVNLNEIGEYDVTCTYEGVSYTKKINVLASDFVGTWTGLSSASTLTSITLNADGTATAVIDGADKTGKFVEENGTYKVTFESTQGIFNVVYDNDILYVKWNYSGSTLSEKFSNIFVKNVADYDVKVVSAFINSATEFSSSNNVKLYAYKLTNKATNEEIKAIMHIKYSKDYDYDYYEYVTSYTSTWYINPTVDGTWFDGVNKVTLGSDTFDLTFTTESEITTMSFVKGTASSSGSTGGTTTPSEEVGPEKGTYTGDFTLTLDGKGVATLEGSSYEANYNGFKYKMNGNDVILTWTDKNYDSQMVILELSGNTFTVKASDDFNNTYAFETSIKIQFLGNGYANANFFDYSSEVCTYTRDGKTVVLTSGENSATFELSNGNNTLKLVEYTGKIYKKDVTTLICENVLNHRLTVSDTVRVALNGNLNIADVFKMEYVDENGEVKTIAIDDTNADMSAVDTTVSGYYIVTFKATYGEELFEASGLVYVYPTPYLDVPETGHWIGKKSSSYSGLYSYELDLAADGSATYTKTEYSKSEYEAEWVLTGNTVTWTYTPYSTPETSTLIYDDGYLFGMVSGSDYTYMFKDLTVTNTISAYIDSKQHVLTIAEDAHGIEKYYYSIGNTPYGEVSVKYNTTNLENGTIFTVSKDKEVIVEGQMTSSSFNLAGDEKGEYTGSGSKLTLDGFGNATYGSLKGTYELVKTYYKVTFADASVKYFSLDASAKAYTEEDESVLLKGTTMEYAILVNEGTDCANIAYDKEVWFKFTATKSATYLIYSTNNGSKDNKGTLYDETGSNQLATNDDGNNTVVDLGGYKYDFLMEQALEEGKTYYIKVTVGYVSGSAPSKYTLNIVEKTA